MNEGDDSVDRISDLHDNLREKILECLSLTDAIRTSELSRKWRYTWTRMGQLVFGHRFLKSMGTLTEERFTRIIDRILLIHQGPLKFFYVNIPQHVKQILYLNGWFINLARKEVREVDIRCTSLNYQLYSMPSYFFDCRRLTYLSLEACVLKLPPDFQGFPNLVECFLEHIHTSSNDLATFISRCPQIMFLELIDVLRFFTEPLHIYAPNLITLHLVDYLSGMINLKYTPQLTCVSLESLENTAVLHIKIYSCFGQLRSLSGIIQLTLHLPLLEPLDRDCHDTLGNELQELKTLTLGEVNICRPADISYMFCLIRSAPNLKILNISIHNPDRDNGVDEHSLECLEAQGRKGYNISQLVEVELHGVTGLRIETMLLKTMLTNCPMLKTLGIESASGIKSEAEVKMSWELNSCRRLSRDVEVVYSKAKLQVLPVKWLPIFDYY